MTQAIETCRYCGRQGGDEFSFGPDDPAPGVCPTCLDARMSALMLGAARRAASGMGQEALKTWLHGEMVELGLTPAWAKRFTLADVAAFAAAQERTHR
jgi:hypothetical protein